MAEPLLRIDNLQVAYGEIAALRGVSLELHSGEIVAIIGANGAGKTTLINTISGILPARAGSVQYRGESLKGTPAYRIARMGIAQVPEGRKLFGKLTVRENLEMGAFAVKDRRKVESQCAAMEELFPILGQRRTQAAGTLSGGEQQMLAIARALMSEPTLMLLDEPSMGLSPILVEKVFNVISQINSRGISVLLVEQNARKSLQISSRAYVLETGSIVMSGDSSDLLANPQVKQAYLGA